MNINKNDIICDLNNILIDAKHCFKLSKNIEELKSFKSKFLGKNSFLNKKIKIIKFLSNDDKKEIGILINKIKFNIYNIFLKSKKIIKNIDNFYNLDITIPSFNKKIGNLHPISIEINNLKKIFINLGFKIINTNEIENHYNNFDFLNIPINHPSRNKKNTFWINKINLLRTHTSNVQNKIFNLNKKYPIKILSFGKVYRKDKDKTHTPMFHQIDGIYIDKNVNFSNLKYFILNLIKLIINNKNLKIRFRPSYFPFTEPSIEIDIFFNKNWIEILGAGIMKNIIIKNLNINKDYTGFAFGIGIERVIMIKYNIEDIKCLFKNNLLFLKQFRYI